MSENKLEFLTRMMNDPSVRQRLKNAEERRAYCEEEWTKQNDEAEVAEPTPEPDPEPDQAEVDEPDQADETSPGEDQVDDDQADQAEQ